VGHGPGSTANTNHGRKEGEELTSTGKERAALHGRGLGSGSAAAERRRYFWGKGFRLFREEDRDGCVWRLSVGDWGSPWSGGEFIALSDRLGFRALWARAHPTAVLDRSFWISDLQQ
jgi:hypothetical protein